MKILSFSLNDELYGIEISNVKEINRNVEYSFVPTAPKNVLGLLNLRGQVVTLLDLAMTLNFGKSKCNGVCTCIILKSQFGESGLLAVLIDKTGDVIDIDDSSLEAPPLSDDSHRFAYLKYIAHVNGELLMVIDTEKIISF